MIKPEHAAVQQFIALEQLSATDPELADASRHFIGNRSQIAAWSIVGGLIEGTVPTPEEAEQNGAAAEVLRRQVLEAELLAAYPRLLEHLVELEIPVQQQVHMTATEQKQPFHTSL
ncbi:hypothetical protein H7097_04200 [Aeromicrobium sp.]|nr:hypothetical protein [Candidatus Saccharibacteria bacterium]